VRSGTSGPVRDVAILGGGLAGLTLALQLRQRDPALDVLVLERNAHPVAEAAFKVGESTVEVGAHYFADVLGLREHLRHEQLVKFGLRYFFNDRSAHLDRCTELGVSQLLPTTSWQLDRGRFENFLGEHARSQGIDFRDGAVVRGIALGEAGAMHHVDYEHAGAMHRIAAVSRSIRANQPLIDDPSGEFGTAFAQPQMQRAGGWTVQAGRPATASSSADAAPD
jgi:2-polyprenyl-6-methoxyphenol hydroxylase-like FAD-dependent oxidoreductase